MIKTCEQCGKKFEAPDDRWKYCSNECRRKACNSQKNARYFRQKVFETEWDLWKRDFLAKKRSVQNV